MSDRRLFEPTQAGIKHPTEWECTDPSFSFRLPLSNLYSARGDDTKITLELDAGDIEEAWEIVENDGAEVFVFSADLRAIVDAFVYDHVRGQKRAALSLLADHLDEMARRVRDVSDHWEAEG